MDMGKRQNKNYYSIDPRFIKAMRNPQENLD